MKVVANKDSFGFQNKGWKKGDIAEVKNADFPEAKHFENLDGSPLVKEVAAKAAPKKSKEEADAELQAKIKADLDKELAHDEAKKKAAHK